jgi:molybdopterin converting factor small subunit
VFVKVLFYGRLAEVIGPELEIDAPLESSIAQLRERLVTRYPEAGQPLRSRRALVCVGDTMVLDDYVLRDGDKVEFLPPVSGG